MPFGEVDSPINTAALDHYNDLIDTCLAYGVKPIVTLSHDDAPLNLTYQDPSFADAFLYYAKHVMTRYSVSIVVGLYLINTRLTARRIGWSTGLH